MAYNPDFSFQILSCNQVWKDDNDDSVFDHRMVVLRRGEQYFFGRDPRRKGDIDPAQMSLERIPITHIRAPFSADLTRAPDLPLDLKDIFIKEPNLLSYGNCSPTQRQTFFEPQLQEAHIYEQLRQHPHPNIGIYHGCVVRDGRIEGLCLERYDRTLADLLREGALGYDQKRAYLQDVKRGVAHLHSLKLVHGDLNPSNIMVDSQANKAVITDFDSCRPVGQLMGDKAGTTGWGSVDPQVAELEHDRTALQRIEEYVLSDS
ncbi:serine/threonine-protein kinase-like protein [Colletotrichum cereale]|nr:serine/threonine-protein kinase-like protein [Colletotrichum cereale]